MLLYTMKLILIIFSVLLSVAFITLFERKSLSYIQKRKGPNKVGWKGVLQPFSDALKLFSKEPMKPSMSNFLVFSIGPMAMFTLSFLLWFTLPSSLGSLDLSISMVFILCCLSAGVYPVMASGWSSNSKFSLLGSLRAIAQSTSYEVSMAITLLSLILLVGSYSVESFLFPFYFISATIMLPICLIWGISALAETSRTPFDFTEGESELVSGFNTEFSAGGFILFFLAEYSSLLFMSVLFSLMFLGVKDLLSPSLIIFILVIFLSVWTRGTLPRLRYDKLMYLAWKSFLPISLSFLIVFSSLFSYMNSYKY